MNETIPLEGYYDPTTVSEFALLPSGTRAAFVAREFDRKEDEPRRTLFVVPTDGPRWPHRLTRSRRGEPALESRRDRSRLSSGSRRDRLAGALERVRRRV